MTRVRRTPAPSLAGMPRTSRATERAAVSVEATGEGLAMTSASGYTADLPPPKWGAAAPGSTGVEPARGMPALRLLLPLARLHQHATLLMGAETRPLRDLLDGAPAASAEMAHGVERADAVA